MKRILLVSILSMVLVLGCAQQPVKKESPKQQTEQTETEEKPDIDNWEDY